MNKPISPPHLDPADDLSGLPNFDLNSVINPIMANRTRSPISITSQAGQLSALFPDTLPRNGLPLPAVLDEVHSATDTYCRRLTHPGFFGYIAPSGLPTDPLSHAMVAALNQNVTGYPGSAAAATIEKTVVDWLAKLVGYPDHADGILLSGGSIANLTAMGAALISRFGSAFRSEGLRAAAGSKQPVIVCSETAHFSIQRAAALLGLGTNHVVSVEVDARFRMRIDRLVEVLKANSCPVCVVASAGTTTTGAIDPLGEIASICESEGVWLHVDAAYGGAGLLSPTLSPRYAGIEGANSVTMDLHKWFFMALDCSVLLYRDASAAKQMFYESSDYVQFPLDGPPEQHMFFHLGPELSRRFRALPLYIAFRHYGADRLGRNILHNVQCAQYLQSLIQAEPRLETVAAPQLSICCFRYAPEHTEAQTKDEINRCIRAELEREGNFLLSATDIRGRPVLRVCIINYATRAHHIDELVKRILEIGGRLA